MIIKGILYAVFILLTVGFLLGIVITGITWYYKAADMNTQLDRTYYSYNQDELAKFKAEMQVNKVKLASTKKSKLIIFSILSLIAIACTIFIPGNIHQVDATEVAVVKKFGTIVGTRDAGLHWDFYFTNNYVYYSTTIREVSLDSQAYSSDTQYIGLTVELQYKIDPQQVVELEKTYKGIDNLENKIKVVAIDKVKSIYAKYKATEVMEHRDTISNEIKDSVKLAVENQYPVLIETIAVPNIDFSDTFEKSVEDALASKVAAEQAALKAESEAKKVEIEADAAAYTAKKEAEAAAYAIEQQADAALKKAEKEAEALIIAAKADAEKAQIEADAAEYQGQREAAIKLQALASVNGWTVVKYVDPDGTTYNKLMKGDGSLVSDTELEAGVKNLLTSEYYAKWDGQLPTYYMGSSGTVTVVTTP